MTISDLKHFFKNEISSMYSESENSELYSIFCNHILGLDKFQLRKSYERIITEDECENFKNIIGELKTGKPFQQILGGRLIDRQARQLEPWCSKLRLESEAERRPLRCASRSADLSP